MESVVPSQPDPPYAIYGYPPFEHVHMGQLITFKLAGNSSLDQPRRRVNHWNAEKLVGAVEGAADPAGAAQPLLCRAHSI